MPTDIDSGSLSDVYGPLDHEYRSQRTRELLDLASRCADPVELAGLHQQVVVLNLGVADALAARYARRGLEPSDLCQVARLALVRVVPQFRPEFGRDFLAYAVPSIVGSLRKHFRDTGWTVRPPRRIQEAHHRIRSIRPELCQRLGREPTAAEVAAAADLEEEVVLEALEVGNCYQPSSLDREVGDQGSGEPTTLANFLGEEDGGFARTEARVALAPLVAALGRRDRMVVELRFFEGLTQGEIGERIGVSQMQVSRILSRILATLRDGLGDLDGAGDLQEDPSGAA